MGGSKRGRRGLIEKGGWRRRLAGEGSGPCVLDQTTTSPLSRFNEWKGGSHDPIGGEGGLEKEGRGTTARKEKGGRVSDG